MEKEKITYHNKEGTLTEFLWSASKPARTPCDFSQGRKDVMSKTFGERLKDKSLKVYNVDVPRIIDVRPTNLPAVEANELRIDNLFVFEDGTVGIIIIYTADIDPGSTKNIVDLKNLFNWKVNFYPLKSQRWKLLFQNRGSR